VKIPAGDRRQDRFKRFDFFKQLIERCTVSREERRGLYQARRLAYLYGSDGSWGNADLDIGVSPPPGNKIYPHLDQLTSFLYAQATTIFSTEVGVATPDYEMGRLDIINRYINDQWHRSNLDIVFGTALLNALVFGCTFVKPIWRGNALYPAIVMPHNVGVLREDEMQLSRQECYCHWYPITETQFRNDYALLPRLEPILERLEKRGQGMLETQEAGVDRIIMSAMHPLGSAQAGPSGTGMADWMSVMSLQYVPRVKEQLIDMVELVVWDDALNDYRLVTLAAPDIVIFDRPLRDTGWLEHEPSMIQIAPSPMADYFWGVSEVERLMPLQRYRNRCLAQIDHLQDLQAHPPWTSSGFPAPELLEMQLVLDSPGGFLNQPNPADVGGGGPKADRVKIELPQDLYERLSRIDEMFDEMSGLPAVTRGQNPPGVRAGGHATDLAKLGSSRARKRALIVEDCLEQVATIALRLMQKYDPTILSAPVPGGKPTDVDKFVLNQFTKDFIVRVDAHSNTPIFTEDLTSLVFSLLKAKAIERDDAIDMLPIPKKRQLIHKLRTVIEPAEAKSHQAAQQFELEKAKVAGLRGRPRKMNGQSSGAPEAGG
jgi:hypothetical protein